jgi:hypothetical protein
MQRIAALYVPLRPINARATGPVSSPDEAKRNPGLLYCVRETRIALRSIRATLASQHLILSHLVSIRVFDVEPAYQVGSRIDFGYIAPGAEDAANEKGRMRTTHQVTRH